MKKQLGPLLLVLVCLGLGFLGCDSSEDDQASLIGSYAATQVNGRALPAQAFQVVLGNETFQADLFQGTLLLRVDMTYRLDRDFRVNENIDDNDDGDYSVSGRTTRFFPEDEEGYSGTIRGNVIEATFFPCQ